MNHQQERGPRLTRTMLSLARRAVFAAEVAIGWGGTLVEGPSRIATDGHLAVLLEAVYPWALSVAIEPYGNGVIDGPDPLMVGPYEPRPGVPESFAWEIWQKNIAGLEAARTLMIAGTLKGSRALVLTRPHHDIEADVWCNPYKYTAAFGMVRFDGVRQGPDPLGPLFLFDETAQRVNAILMPLRPFLTEQDFQGAAREWLSVPPCVPERTDS